MNRIALTRLIESDRKKCAAVGIRVATTVSAALVRQAIAASGRQPEFAVTLVRQLARQRLVPLIRDVMLAADLMGRRRVVLRAAPVLAKKEKIRLAGTVFDETISLMQKRLALSDTGLKALSNKYADAAFRISDNMTKALERKLYDQIIQSVKDGDLYKDAVEGLRGVFEKEGLAPWSNYKLEAVFRTQAQIGYAAGRYASQHDPAVQEILWGYEYSAIEDDRTTELCQSLDKTKLPKDDPFWAQYTPPNHYNCRSTVLEVFNDEEPVATPAPDELEQPADGFRVNFGEALMELSVKRSLMHLFNNNHDELGRFAPDTGGGSGGAPVSHATIIKTATGYIGKYFEKNFSNLPIGVADLKTKYATAKGGGIILDKALVEHEHPAFVATVIRHELYHIELTKAGVPSSQQEQRVRDKTRAWAIVNSTLSRFSKEERAAFAQAAKLS